MSPRTILLVAALFAVPWISAAGQSPQSVYQPMLAAPVQSYQVLPVSPAPLAKYFAPQPAIQPV